MNSNLMVVLMCSCACGISPVPTPALDGAVMDGSVMDGAERDIHRALFIGNSYIFTHDIAGRYGRLVASGGAISDVRQVTTGGYRWSQHVDDLASPDAEITTALAPGNMLDVVILQEQSLLGGAPLEGSTQQRLESVAAARELSRRASEAGARVILYQTWGRRDGNEGESFERMSTWLAQNYVVLAQALERDGVDVDVAPVGIAFHIVHDDVLASGGDPTSPSSPFYALYEADGSHPSIRGAYLAACVIAGASTGGAAGSFPDAPELEPAVSDSLRSACERALDDPRLRGPTPTLFGLDDDVDTRPLTPSGVVAAWSGDGRRAIVNGPAGRGMFVNVDERWVEDESWTAENSASTSFALSQTGNVVVGLPLGVTRLRDEGWVSEELPHERPPGRIAISGDGRVIAVGRGRFSNDDPAILVRVYEHTGERWRMTSSVEGFATSQTRPYLKLDGLGTTLLISEGNDGVRVMVRIGDEWREEAVLREGLAPIWLSVDGARALLFQHNQLHIFERTGGRWLRSSTDSRLWGLRPFGTGFAVSGDVRTIVASGRHIFRPEDEAMLHVLRWSEGRFSETHLLFAEGRFENFPSSVHISADARQVIAGSPSALFELP